MTQLIVEPARLRDLRPVRQLFVVATHNHFGYLPYQQRLRIIRDNNLRQLLTAKIHPQRIIMTAREQNNLFGYAVGSVEDKVANLYWLYVEPSRRGQNIGLKLLAAICRAVEEKGADSLALATHAHESYYTRQGFRHIDTRQIHGVEMKIMKLSLKNAT